MCDLCYEHLCNPRCPNYISKSHIKCSICNSEIENGEEYIVNDDGEYAHWECIDVGRKLVEFLGYEIKEMGDTNDTIY